jgi:hypothetical protein
MLLCYSFRFLLPIPLLNSDSFSKDANISPLHSTMDFKKPTVPLFHLAFSRLAPSNTPGSALLTIINGCHASLSDLFYLLLHYVD